MRLARGGKTNIYPFCYKTKSIPYKSEAFYSFISTEVTNYCYYVNNEIKGYYLFNNNVRKTKTFYI